MLTLHNLERGLVKDDQCPLCKSDVESMVHLFRDCNFTIKVLQGLGEANSTINKSQSWHSWLVEKFLSYDLLKCKTIAIACWAILYNKNSVYHKGLKSNV
ncbi:hypothetical protein PVK06_039804 [Gossypium arboreum]|uniref:Reverse transcriptase zinc-binding domain-containing protein n=1 Tax=Gossypium arboreum TaxID=29729 RepID=A0ABR0N3U7_GOSAR|nr:hypothetical protein PVK06_039804 [Gossypium arboreum]